MAVVRVNGLIGGAGGGSFSAANVAYDPANFTSNGTWTVAAFSASNYVKMGLFSNNAHVRIFYVYITGDYVGAGASFLNINVPGLVWTDRVRVAGEAFITGVNEACGLLATEGTSLLRFERLGGLGWPGGTTILVAAQVTVFI